MTFNGVMAIILRYFSEFSTSYGGPLRNVVKDTPTHSASGM